MSSAYGDYWWENARCDVLADARNSAAEELVARAIQKTLDDDVPELMRTLLAPFAETRDYLGCAIAVVASFGGEVSDRLAEVAMEAICSVVNGGPLDEAVAALSDRLNWDGDDEQNYVETNEIRQDALDMLRDETDNEDFVRSHAPGKL